MSPGLESSKLLSFSTWARTQQFTILKSDIMKHWQLDIDYHIEMSITKPQDPTLGLGFVRYRRKIVLKSPSHNLMCFLLIFDREVPVHYSILVLFYFCTQKLQGFKRLIYW